MVGINLNPVHGIDYLQDHYSVLDIPKDADKATITSAFRTLIKGVHPDRVEGLDKEIQAQARWKTDVLNRAYETLKDPKSRAEYDKRLEEFDPKYISKDGVPIINSKAKRIDLDSIVAGNSLPEKDQTIEQAKILSGYDENTLEILRGAYESNSDNKTKEAYRSMLGKKEMFLRILEEYEFAEAGIMKQEDTQHLSYSEDHLKQRQEQIGLIEAEIGAGVEARILAIGSGDAPLLLGSDVEYTRENALELREKLTAIALENFGKHRKEFERIAKERADALEELVCLTDWRYTPEDQPLYDRIDVYLERNKQLVEMFSFKIHGMERVEQLERQTEGLNAEQYLENFLQTENPGINAAILELNPDIDFKMQIIHVVGAHANKLEKEK